VGRRGPRWRTRRKRTRSSVRCTEGAALANTEDADEVLRALHGGDRGAALLLEQLIDELAREAGRELERRHPGQQRVPVSLRLPAC
jgi:hypothetical protein